MKLGTLNKYVPSQIANRSGATPGRMQFELGYKTDLLSSLIEDRGFSIVRADLL